MMDSNQSLLYFLLIAPLTLVAGQDPTELTHQSAERFVSQTENSLRYLVYFPEGYAHSGDSWPLLLFLHGGGESGQDLERVKVHGPPRLVEQGQAFPMIIVSPQNPEARGFWDEDLLAMFVDEMESRYRVDSSRIYLTGLSRGAYGAWRLAMENPDRFAALVPISGAAPAPYAGWLKDMPIWVFHGAKDPVIPVSESERIVTSIRQAGRMIKFTVYPDAGHDAWTQAYADPALWTWMLEQHR